MSVLLDLLGAGLAGLASGIIMTLFEIPSWKKWGLEGVAEWQVNTVMVTVLIKRFTRKRPGILMIVAMHLAHATILGMVFAVLLILSQTSVLFPAAVGYGVVYSIVLWIISPYLTRSLFENAGGFQMTTRGLTISFLSHIVYGIALGILVPVLV